MVAILDFQNGNHECVHVIHLEKCRKVGQNLGDVHLLDAVPFFESDGQLHLVPVSCWWIIDYAQFARVTGGS